MRPLEYELNEFGTFLAQLCKRNGKTFNQVAKDVGYKSTSKIFYAIRADKRRRWASTLPIADLQKIARAVRATHEETNQLVILGLKQQLPLPARDYVAFLENISAKAFNELGKKMPVYHVKGS